MASSGEFPLTQRQKNSQTPVMSKVFQGVLRWISGAASGFRVRIIKCNDYPEEAFAREIRIAGNA